MYLIMIDCRTAIETCHDTTNLLTFVVSLGREEQLYHPKVYKKLLCDRYSKGSCPRYYCPFAHSEYELKDSIDISVVKMLTQQSQDELLPVHPCLLIIDEKKKHLEGLSYTDESNIHGSRIRVDHEHQTKQQNARSANYNLSETIHLCFMSYEVLVSVWIGLSRICSLKHPQLAVMKPLCLFHNGIPFDREYEGGIISVSVDSGLHPLETWLSLDHSRLTQFMIDFIKCVEALHKNQIVHGQIHPNCILIDSQCKVVLSGFLSGILSLCQDSQPSDTSLIWTTPEVILAILRNDPFAIQQFKTFASDMWNVGLCLFYFFNNCTHPFGNSPTTIITNILCDTKFNLYSLHSKSPFLFDLIVNLLNLNPEDRYTATEALQHPFFWTGKDTREFLHQYCSVLFSSNIDEVSKWTTTQSPISFNSRFKSLQECLNGLIIPENVNWSELLNRFHSQSTDGLMTFVYLICTNDRVDENDQERLIMTLLSEFPVQVIDAYKSHPRPTGTSCHQTTSIDKEPHQHQWTSNNNCFKNDYSRLSSQDSISTADITP